MNIKDIELRSFRCFKEAKIEGLGPLNFFGGKNGTGKSTILDAIAFALTGTCRGAETGRALDELRTQRDGQHAKVKAGVVLTLADGKQIVRMEDQGPKAAIQKEIDKMLGFDPAVTRACLYAGELLRLPRRDAQALVMDLLPSQIVEIPAEVQASLRKYLHVELKTASLKTIEKLYDDAYKARGEASRLLKELGKLDDPPKAPDFLKADDDPKAVRIKIVDALARLRKERDSAMIAGSDLLHQRQAGEAKLAQARTALEEVTSALGQLRTAAEIGKAATALAAELSNLEETNKAKEEALSRLRKEMSFHEGTVRAAQARLESYKKLGGECPTCSTKLTPTKKRTMEEELVASIEQAKRDGQKVRLELDVQAEPVSTGGILRKLSDLEGEEQSFVRYTGRKQTLEKTIADVTAALAKTEAAPPVDTTKIEERIVTGEARLQDLDRYIAVLGQHQRIAAEASTSATEQKALDALCDVFGPKGLRLELQTGKGIEEFAGAIAGMMGTMGFTFDLGPLLRVQDDPLVNGIPARLLSASEQLRFSMAFAIAVSAWSKLGFVCVDAWDSLDEDSSAAAGALLAGLADVQRFVFVTPRKGMAAYMGAAAANNLGKTGTRFYAVTGGAEGSSVSLP